MDIDIITDNQLYHALLGLILIFVALYCGCAFVDSILFIYHKWIKKDLYLIRVKTNWKDL